MITYVLQYVVCCFKMVRIRLHLTKVIPFLTLIVLLYHYLDFETIHTWPELKIEPDWVSGNSIFC